MKKKLFALFAILGISQFASAAGLTAQCTFPNTDPWHVFAGKVVMVIINDEFSGGSADKFDYNMYGDIPTELLCNGSQSKLECKGVVWNNNYPAGGNKEELLFAQKNWSYKLTVIYSSYPHVIKEDFFDCTVES